MNENHDDISASGGDCLERVREMLRSLDIDDEAVTKVRVQLWRENPDAEEDDANDESENEGEDERWNQYKGLDSDDESEQEVITEPEERYQHSLGGHGNGGGVADSEYNPHNFKGEAIRPDTIQGCLLGHMKDSPDDWFWLYEEADELDISSNQANDAASTLLKKGYVQKRKIDPQPNMRGVQKEFSTTEAGRGAIREGRRRAEKAKEEKREREEAEMNS